MSIYRPREAASECEGLAAHCTRVSMFWGSGDTAKFYREQARLYSFRRASIIAKYGIKCCPIPPAYREGEA